MNAFQPMIRNILEEKQLTDDHQKIKIVERIAKMDCGWPLHHCYDMVPQPIFISIGISILQVVEIFHKSWKVMLKSTAIICTTRINKFFVWPEVNKFWLFYMYFP